MKASTAKTYPPNATLTEPRNDFIPLDSVSEIDQYLAAQQLIAQISDQFARNKSMLESWFISASVEEFAVSYVLVGILFSYC